jgi:cellulose synthase/poly-beta-1,6-N-acetylglucosamine synthase-like glycosyltransferase
MTFSKGAWKAKLSNQSNTSIDFKITAYDYAGNSAETRLYQFEVKAPTGLSLFLILLIIIILSALTGSAIYLLWRRKQKKKSAGGAHKPTPPSPPSTAPKLAAPIRGYEMVSFVVPARNEGSTISQRIARAYELAVNHVGPSEIIVVDDGSMDDTYEAAWSAIKSNRRKWPNIRAKVVKLSSTIGKEEAVQFGRNKATGEIVEIVNGDTSKILSLIIPIGLSIFI